MSLPLQTSADETDEQRRKKVEELRERYLSGRLTDADLIPEDADVTELLDEIRTVDPPPAPGIH